MKVLHITASSNFGGGPEFICRLSQYLSRYSVSSFVACQNGAYVERFSFSNQVLIFNSFFFNSIKLIRFVSRKFITHIHLHGRGSLFIALFPILFFKIFNKKIYIIYTPHGSTPKFNLVNYLAFRLSSYFTDVTTFVSSDEFINFNNFFNNKLINYRIIDNPGLEIQHHDIMPPKNRRVIQFSRFDIQKNSLLFCEIAKLMPNFEFIIYGDGKFRKFCELYKERENINNLYFYDFTNKPINAILECSIYLSTSIWEGSPLAALEAISLSRTTILSNVLGHKHLEKFNFKNVFLYDLKNFSIVCNLINNSINFNMDSFKSDRIKYLTNLSPDICFSQYLKLYNEKYSNTSTS